MCLYGLAHMGYRHSLPGGIIWVGLFYQAAGIVCLLLPNLTFMNPWPMGLVFFVGETIGGWILKDGSFETAPEQCNETDEGDDHEAN
jgi:hypothetical protein